MFVPLIPHFFLRIIDMTPDITPFTFCQLHWNGGGQERGHSCGPQGDFGCLQKRNVESARVAPSTWQTQGGLECLHLEARHSIFCWSIFQPFQVRNSSGIALWGWWRRCLLRTLTALYTNQCPFAVLMLISSASP